MKDFSRSVKFDNPDAFRKMSASELQLLAVFDERKAAVHRALCDSINTPQAMKEVNGLVSAANTYMSSCYSSPEFNHVLVKDVAKYVTDLLKMFGVVEVDGSVGLEAAKQAAGGGSLEETIMPYLNVMSKFRDDVRGEARVSKATGVLRLCDELRDTVLPELGVLIEDLADRTVVKLCDRETLLREREQKLLVSV